MLDKLRGTWFKNVLDALEQFLSVTAGLSSTTNVTFATRAHMANKQGKRWGRWTCSLLNYIEDNHCEVSLKEEISYLESDIEDLKTYL